MHCLWQFSPRMAHSVYHPSLLERQLVFRVALSFVLREGWQGDKLCHGLLRKQQSRRPFSFIPPTELFDWACGWGGQFETRWEEWVQRMQELWEYILWVRLKTHRGTRTFRQHQNSKKITESWKSDFPVKSVAKWSGERASRGQICCSDRAVSKYHKFSYFIFP